MPALPNDIGPAQIAAIILFLLLNSFNKLITLSSSLKFTAPGIPPGNTTTS